MPLILCKSTAGQACDGSPLQDDFHTPCQRLEIAQEVAEALLRMLGIPGALLNPDGDSEIIAMAHNHLSPAERCSATL